MYSPRPATTASSWFMSASGSVAADPHPTMDKTSPNISICMVIFIPRSRARRLPQGSDRPAAPSKLRRTPEAQKARKLIRVCSYEAVRPDVNGANPTKRPEGSASRRRKRGATSGADRSLVAELRALPSQQRDTFRGGIQQGNGRGHGACEQPARGPEVGQHRRRLVPQGRLAPWGVRALRSRARSIVIGALVRNVMTGTCVRSVIIANAMLGGVMTAVQSTMDRRQSDAENHEREGRTRGYATDGRGAALVTWAPPGRCLGSAHDALN